jgi:hypothetical protein
MAYDHIGLLAEAASRIRDIEEAARDHEELGETLALRIEDAGALAQDIEEALR